MTPDTRKAIQILGALAVGVVIAVLVLQRAFPPAPPPVRLASDLVEPPVTQPGSPAADGVAIVAQDADIELKPAARPRRKASEPEATAATDAAPATPIVVPPPPAQTTELPQGTSPRPTARIYGPADRDVAPPKPIGELHLSVPDGRDVLVEVVIDEEGNVEASSLIPNQTPTLSDSVFATFALHTVNAWRFEPGTKEGAPVKYRQRLRVSPSGTRPVR